jgi:hypothetical protein
MNMNVCFDFLLLKKCGEKEVPLFTPIVTAAISLGHRPVTGHISAANFFLPAEDESRPPRFQTNSAE